MPDSVVYQTALNQTLSYNNSRALRTSGLYTGSLYARDYYNVKGNPFFETDSFQKGDVYYNGVLYKNADLLYDLSHDNVITKYSDDANLVLVSEKIAYFHIGDHLFVRGNESFPAGSGFYELLYDGTTQVFAKRTKKMVPWSKTMEFSAAFSQANVYYLLKDTAYFAANSKSEMLEAFKGKRAEIKEFISKNKLDFRKHLEDALVKIARYYDEITK